MNRTHTQIVQALESRWPENKIGRSQARIRALTELLGNPQDACPVIMITGTNGKGSTAALIDSLLRATGLRVGRFTSPHLNDLTERIHIDGHPIRPEVFDELVGQVSPLVEIVDSRQLDGIAMTFFEVMTALAYAAFADAPVDVAVVEVGMGGTWDATNITAPVVSVVAPIDYDHTAILGSTLTEIATEKAGIIPEHGRAVLAAQDPEAAKVLLERCTQTGAEVAREGIEFGLLSRTPAVGGQVLRLETADGPLGDLFLPLFGEHMARNAALAVAAVEAFLGGRGLAPEVLAEGLAQVQAPGRLEVVRRSPAIVIDSCHNPHGTRAALKAVEEAFAFNPLIVVVAMMSDKDVAQVMAEIAAVATSVVATQISGNPRAMPVAELARIAAEQLGSDRVRQAPDLTAAIDEAVRLADESGPTAGILIAGSVYAAGEARALLASGGDDEA